MTINLNTNYFSSGENDLTPEYDVAQAAKIFKFKNVGRNKLYHIMREMGLVNIANWPAQQYINEGLLKGIVASHNMGNKPKTIIIGQEGLDFVRGKVQEYINNPEEATKNVLKPPFEVDYGISLDL